MAAKLFGQESRFIAVTNRENVQVNSSAHDGLGVTIPVPLGSICLVQSFLQSQLAQLADIRVEAFPHLTSIKSVVPE